MRAQEEYLPCSVEWFLSRATAKKKDQVVIPKGQVTPEKLLGMHTVKRSLCRVGAGARKRGPWAAQRTLLRTGKVPERILGFPVP